MIEISDIPLEVLETIFYKLDGKSFLSVPSVCRKWRYVAQNVESNFPFWKKSCICEICPHVLGDLVGCQDLAKAPERKNRFWRSIYFCWLRTSCIGETPFQTHEHVTKTSHDSISCMKASGNWVLTGHINGSFYCWNLQIRGRRTKICQHLSTVEDIALVNVIHNGPYGNVREPWDHHHVISLSTDEVIINTLLSGGTCEEKFCLNRIYKPLSAVKMYDDLVALFYCDNKCDIYSIKFDADQCLDIQAIRSVEGPYESVSSFHLWENNIYWFCASGDIKCHGELSSGDFGWKNVEFLAHGENVIEENLSSICDVFAFYDHIVFVNTDDGKMMMSIKDRVIIKELDLMSYLGGTIVSICLNGGLLAIGTDFGKIFLYHVPNIEDLKNIELHSPDFCLTLCNLPLLSISIVFKSQYPVVIASTMGSFYILKWPNNIRASRT